VVVVAVVDILLLRMGPRVPARVIVLKMEESILGKEVEDEVWAIECLRELLDPVPAPLLLPLNIVRIVARPARGAIMMVLASGEGEMICVDIVSIDLNYVGKWRSGDFQQEKKFEEKGR